MSEYKVSPGVGYAVFGYSNWYEHPDAFNYDPGSGAYTRDGKRYASIEEYRATLTRGESIEEFNRSVAEMEEATDDDA